jgi:hypothetical protein
MKVLIWIIFILLVLFLLTLCKVRAEILYLGEPVLVIRYLFFKIQLPRKKSRKDAPEADMDEFSEEKSDIRDEQSFRERVQSTLDFLEHTFAFSKKTLSYLKKKLVCEKLQAKIALGSGDAAVTAISVGGLWGFLYTAYAAITRYFTVTFQKPDFEVTPLYNEKKFDFKFHGIFSIRVVNIIVIGFLTLRYFIALKSDQDKHIQDKNRAKKRAEG